LRAYSMMVLCCWGQCGD